MKRSSRAAGMLKRGACCVLAASLCFIGPGATGLSAWAGPADGGDGDGDATTAAKQVNAGTDVLTAPDGGWTAAEGNYLYFGTHDGYVDDGSTWSQYNARGTVSPTKYRVLSNADGQILLDSDELLWVDQYKKRYYKDPRNYADSDVNAYLKDAWTLPDNYATSGDTTGSTRLFNDAELEQIQSTDLAEESSYTEEGLKEGAYYYETATDDVKAFLLSANEVDAYYASLADSEKSFAPEKQQYMECWTTWLRSKVDASAAESMETPHYAGLTYDGQWGYDTMDQKFGVSPAAYLGTGNILFTTDNEFSKKQGLRQVSTSSTQTWKATLQQGGSFAVGDGTVGEDGTVTMDYTYSDAAFTATQISVLIASDELEDGGEVLYYGKVADAPSDSGTFSFTVPDGLPKGYVTYAFAEQVNAKGYTDYATAPASFTWNCEVSFETLDGEDPSSTGVSSGSTVTKPDDPEREGYTFAGWYTDEECTAGNEYDFDTPVTKNFTLYAKWKENPAWERLAGNTAIGTMKQIVNEGWETSDWAIVATNASYYDALSASGLAGLLDAPVLLTAPDSLTPATKALIEAKAVKNVVVVGGPQAVSEDAFTEISAIDGVTAERVWGNTAVGTANKIYDYGAELAGSGAIQTTWGTDAVVATTKSYQDAASIAPYAYAAKAPVFLAGDTLAAGTLTRATAEGFTRTLVIGGEQAVSADVASQLTSPTRLGGNNAYGTSKKVAEFCLGEGGMTVAHMGVATGRSYQDAIVGAALCGKNNSILVLADDKNSTNVSVVAANKAELGNAAYIFGGTQAVSLAVEKAILAASK